MPLHIVIARYEEELDWVISDLVPLCSPDRIFVYNKGKSACTLLDPNVHVESLPNIGREAHTYLHHIINTYHINGLDVTTLFIPGSCRELSYKWESLCSIITILLRGIGNGHSVFPCTASKDVDLENFSLDVYVGSHEKNATENPIVELEPSPIRPYGKWCREVLGTTNTDCITYWGIFAVAQKDILLKPLDMYEKLISFVNYHPNHEVAHYLERAWSIVFDPKCHFYAS
jgi:hypothetical protein